MLTLNVLEVHDEVMLVAFPPARLTCSHASTYAILYIFYTNLLSVKFCPTSGGYKAVLYLFHSALMHLTSCAKRLSGGLMEISLLRRNDPLN